ncbi:MAG: ferrous iron transport protein B [Micrococcales bacterium]|nr:ferrous iron transport protein B [Micrococcales bacterium]MCL2666492.1 ferrous iron transport protein B [Micrococcales bacterium]
MRISLRRAAANDAGLAASGTHESAPAPTKPAPTKVVALVGNPNSGKSALFNCLTGARQAVINAPGTTVEVASSTWKAVDARLLDLPGAYSLLARSPDEEVAAQAVTGGPDGPADLVVVLLDAAGLSRSLYLAGQVGLTGVPMVVAVTMTDVACTRGVTIDTDALADLLGVPVVTIDPRTGSGAEDLTTAVRDTLAEPARLRLDGALAPDDEPAHQHEHPLAQVDPRLADAEALFGWVADVQTQVASTPAVHASRSDRVDSWLLRPWVGIPVFLVVLWAVFELVTVVAVPAMNGLRWLVTDWAGGWFTRGLDAVDAPVWLTSFVADGLLVGVATVASFVPLMAVVFVAVGLLEDSGYLARASFVADRAMRRLGLDGRAVLPLVVGFGCNLSALATLRTLPSARQRVLTALLLPFTSCTARLAVYLMLAIVFVPDYAGLVVLAMYALSAVLVVVVGLVLRRTGFRDLGNEPLVLALPAYQRPHLRALVTSAASRTSTFVTSAGKVIVAALALMWLLMAVPVTSGHQLGDVPTADSLYGRAAAAIAPVFAPAGFADAGAAAALGTGIVAKEVVVGSLAQAYGSDHEPWDEGLRAAFDRTSGGHGAAAAIAFCVFVLVYTPCLATVAELARQVGWRWTTGSVAASLLLAWLLAVTVFQLGARL